MTPVGYISTATLLYVSGMSTPCLPFGIHAVCKHLSINESRNNSSFPQILPVPSPVQRFHKFLNGPLLVHYMDQIGSSGEVMDHPGI
jgi:hypothetical protein